MDFFWQRHTLKSRRDRACPTFQLVLFADDRPEPALGACSQAPATVTTTVALTEEVSQPEPTPAPAEPTAAPEPVLEPATPEQLDAAFDAYLGRMVAYGAIGLEDFNTLLVEEPPFILDVRTAAEVEANGHIEGAVLIPLNELGENLAYLPGFKKPIVSCCGSGRRCTIALAIV